MFIEIRWKVGYVEVSIIIICKSLQFLVVGDLGWLETSWPLALGAGDAYSSPLCFVAPIEEGSDTIFSVDEVRVLDESEPDIPVSIMKDGSWELILTLCRLQSAGRS